MKMPNVVVDIKFLIDQLLSVQDQVNDLLVLLLNSCSLVDEEEGEREC